MTTSPLRWGTPCTLTFDANHGPHPTDGCFIVTNGGAAYLVVRAHRMRSRYPNRYRLECIRHNPDTVPVDALVIGIQWYARARSRPR